MPATPAEQQTALAVNPRVRDTLGEPLPGAFLAVRRADAAWAQERSLDEGYPAAAEALDTSEIGQLAGCPVRPLLRL